MLSSRVLHDLVAIDDKQNYTFSKSICIQSSVMVAALSDFKLAPFGVDLIVSLPRQDD